MSAIDALFPHLPLALSLAGAMALASVFLTHLATRRTLAQPLALAPVQERDTLRGVLADVRRLPYVASLTPADFAVGVHARIWAALLAACPSVANLPEDLADEDCERIGASLSVRAGEVLTQVHAALAAGPAPVGDAVALAGLYELGDLHEDSASADVAVVEAASAVLAAGTDRNRFSGVGLVVPTNTPDSADPAYPSLHRVLTAPPRLRLLVAAFASAATAAAAPGLVAAAGYAPASPSGVLALAAILVLVATSQVVAHVDLDTFYLDLPVFGVGAGAAWVLTALAALTAGHPRSLLAGALVIAATAALFIGGNALYRLVRGEDGQGLGDSIIIIATSGVPAALTGSWTLGYLTVMAGLFAGVAGWSAGALRGRLTRRSPFAFGPYLAIGWALAWVLLVAGVLPADPLLVS